MIGFRKYWYGKECEGRLTDVETLFISDIDGLNLDEIELGLFVKNLTNTDDFTWVESVLEGFGAKRAYRLRPRTVGLNLAYRF